MSAKVVNNNMDFIKRLTYRRELRKLVRFLHLSKVFRKWYYSWLRPPNGIMTMEVRGISSQFYIQTPGELRILESRGGGGYGEQHILEQLLSSLHPGDVVYDIGSHVGLYTVFLAKAVGSGGQVIAFEPENQNYEHLLNNLKLNNLPNVRAFRKALGDKDGEEKLYLGEDTGNSSLIQPHGRETNYELVELAKGDRFIKAENLPIPKMVKIDVEGYEYNVIEGLCHTLAQPTCELVCCEVHPTLLPAGVNPDAISVLLKSLGFDRVDTYPRDSEYHIVAYKTIK